MSPSAKPAVVVLHNVDLSWPPPATAAVLEDVRQFVTALAAEGHKVFEAPVTGTDLDAALAPYDPARHVVFNWCEEIPGIPRSDVQVARHLKRLGYAYTGSPPDVLAFTWDKGDVKATLSSHGIATPAGRVVETESLEDWLRFPAIVKPAFEHCSTGVDSGAVVLDGQALKDRVAYVRETFSQPALVEDFIDGREFHVTLWGNGRVHMLPPAEMDFSAFPDVRDRLCTFDSKFTPGSRHYEGIQLRVPADLSKRELTVLRRTCLSAYRLLGCRDYARIDLRLRGNVFYVLDVNPNPDISPDTSLTYAAEAVGMTYGAFASRIVRLAAARQKAKRATGGMEP